MSKEERVGRVKRVDHVSEVQWKVVDAQTEKTYKETKSVGNI